MGVSVGVNQYKQYVRVAALFICSSFSLLVLAVESDERIEHCRKLHSSNNVSSENYDDWRKCDFDLKMKAIDDKYRALSEENRRQMEERKRLDALPDVKIGMTRDQVRNKSRWGPPNKINRTTTARGDFEQWVYKSGYLYFTNGKLSAIQD